MHMQRLRDKIGKDLRLFKIMCFRYCIGSGEWPMRIHRRIYGADCPAKVRSPVVTNSFKAHEPYEAYLISRVLFAIVSK